ncbi:hypothetical protein D9Q98_010102 [Chlorella vulgaris]|uniref:Thioredoxin domain-containing protein n=1 Tax=Chlorella vulgaris TaxID=3077 RepID=A0A9D4YWI5_CHLVU|nr:hypothetical protein D9Q98_010102 [Chlorella vulgaris]
MAAQALTGCCARPAAPLASLSPSSRQYSSSAHISRPALLQTSSRRSSAASSRDRATLQVSAFQIPSNKWWLKSAPPNVVHINSVQQLVDTMAGAGDRLVIMDVYAPWCAACKALYPKVMKLVEGRPDVLLLAINFDENKTVVKAMGVKVLPWFMFYRGKACKLQEFSASSKRFHLIEEAVERHSTDRCFLASSDEEPVLAEFPKVMPGKGVSSSSLDLPHSPKPQPQPV